MLTGLQPKEVYHYFQELAAIPHGSGNTDAIAAYCLEFAKRNGLRARKDAAGNVLIWTDGTQGYELSDPVMLQGHLDMVCDKEADCMLDMDKEGIILCTDGVNVWAKGTTLGADNGIAVAFILAILASDTISHPPIEVVLTVDEEIGMLGARALETEELTAKRMINIDSEEEGVLYVSCAGGVRAECVIPFGSEETSGSDWCFFNVEVNGLLGGHSGIEIHKQRTNAVRLLGNVLTNAGMACSLRLVSISGGGKENAIPKNAGAVVCVPESQIYMLECSVAEYLKLIHQELSTTEPEISIAVHRTDAVNRCMDEESTKRIVFALSQVPDGMQRMSPEIPGMVQTSLNLGTVVTEGSVLKLKHLIRSNTASGKQIVLDRLTAFVEYLGGTVTCQSDYPAWEYRTKSPLRETMIQVYEELFQKPPMVTAIHAGLECGILSGKMPAVDMISFGPSLRYVHTPNETMNVASVERSFRYLVRVLEQLK